MTGQEIQRRRADRRLADIGTMIEQYTQQADHLAEQGDYVALGAGLGRLRELRQMLTDLARYVEDKTAPLMPQKFVEEPGLTMERHSGGWERKEWQSEGIARELYAACLVDPATGEKDPDGQAERFLTAITECAPFTGSMQWRVSKLKEWGFQTDEWCLEERGRQTVTVRQTKEEPDD